MFFNYCREHLFVLLELIFVRYFITRYFITRYFITRGCCNIS